MKYIFVCSLLCGLFIPALNAQTQWHKIPLPGSCYFDKIQPVTTGAIMRAYDGHRGLYITENKGQTWRRLEGPFDLLSDPLSSGSNGLRYGSMDSIIMVDARDNEGLIHTYLSKSLGQQWKEVKTAPEGITTAPLIVHKGRVMTYGFRPYVYNEVFNRWDTLIHQQLNLYATKEAIWAFSELGPENLYKSVDGGHTWTTNLVHYASRLVIRGDTILSNAPFQRSFDGGNHWEPAASIYGPIYELFDDGKYQYAVTAFNTFRSADFFQTYDTLFQQSIYNVIRLDQQHILASGALGCYRSKDNGVHWEISNTGIGPSDHGYSVTKVGDYLVSNYVIFNQTNNVYVQAFSSDTGKLWRGCVERPFLYRMIQVNNDYFGVSGTTIYRSQGDITQWEAIAFPELAAYNDVKLVSRNDTLLVIATNPDNYVCRMWLAKTTAPNLIFHLVPAPLPLYAKGYIMHKNALYITDDFAIKKSTNLGQSWQEVPGLGYGGGLYSEGNRLYFIGFQGISYSLNGGNNWLQIPLPAAMSGQMQTITVGPAALYMLDAGSQVFYYNIGSAVWDTLPGFPTGLGPGRVEIFGPYLFLPDTYGDIWTNDPSFVGTLAPTEPDDFLVFPNPTDDILHVQFSGNTLNDNALRVYAQDGATVLAQTNLGNTYTISTRLWPAGIYYLQWRAGNRVYQKKFVKAGGRD
jgi:hypothetical protein